MQHHSEIEGWGADAALQDRPGVPAEYDPPRPVGNMSLAPPSMQSGDPPAVTSPLRPLTPVYGTVVPPHGLSGIIRRLAYRAPDYKARRWMLLMLADRIDVIEHRRFRSAVTVGILALGILGIRSLARAA